MKHMVGQIIPQTTTIHKAVIDDIINAVDGFEPGITMSSANEQRKLEALGCAVGFVHLQILQKNAWASIFRGNNIIGGRGWTSGSRSM
jgi:hypothetical protein